MREVFKEMDEKMVKGFSGIGIFLTAIGTKPLIYHMVAIQAGLVFSKLAFGHKNGSVCLV